MTGIAVDLYSDTVTRPTPAMRRAIAEAEVGDEQLREDPTVNLLQETVAELLGKEAALFLPSGTMCNQVAFAVHCRAGDEILLQEFGHPLLYEVGGPAAMVGAVLRPLTGPRGLYTAEQVRDAIRPAACAGRCARSRRCAKPPTPRASSPTWTELASSTPSWRVARRLGRSPLR